jgi:biotin carboxylase
LLLVAPPDSYRLAPYLAAARRLGVEALVASEGQYSLVGAIASGLHINLRDVAGSLGLICQAAAQGPFDAVVGTDDDTVELACQAAQALGLPHNDPHGARLARRKDLARATLSAAGLPVPDHRLIDLSRSLHIQFRGLRYPCVAKPVALSGSRGVIRADGPDELAAACLRIARIVRDRAGEEARVALVEQFVPGVEVALEGMLERGRLEVLALFDKPDPLDGPYFEESYYVAPSRLDAQVADKVAACVAQACQAYGLRNGPVHAELRIHRGEPWIIEVAARTIGGQCARLLQFGAGQSLEELVLARSLGLEIEGERADGAAGVLMIPIPRAGILRRVEGVTAALRVPCVTDVEISVREGYELVPPPEGDSYLGFVFAEAVSPEQVEAALREAHARLRIIIAPQLPVRVAPALARTARYFLGRKPEGA